MTVKSNLPPLLAGRSQARAAQAAAYALLAAMAGNLADFEEARALFAGARGLCRA